MNAFIRFVCCCAVSLLVFWGAPIAGPAERRVEKKSKAAAANAAEEQARTQAEAETRAAAQAAASTQRQAEVDAQLLRADDDLARIKTAPVADTPVALQLALGDLGRLMDLFDATPELLLRKRIKETNLRLCEATIQLTRRMAPPPDVPEEVRREVAFGMTALKRAQDNAGIRESALHFQEALRRAPWVAGVWFNFAAVLEKLEAYDDAAASLRLYLLADPQATDASAVQSKIYELEYLAADRAKRDVWLGTWTATGSANLASSNKNYPVTLRLKVINVAQNGEVTALVTAAYQQSEWARRYGFVGKEFPCLGWVGMKLEDGHWVGRRTDHGLTVAWPRKTVTVPNSDITFSFNGDAELVEQGGAYQLRMSCSQSAGGAGLLVSMRYVGGVQKEDAAARPILAQDSPDARRASKKF